MIGFWARNNIAVGGTNYGFFSDIAAATNTYQLYMQGTAESIINGPLSVGTTLAASLNGAAFFYVGGANPHPSTATTVYGAKIDYTVPSTGTGTPYGLMVNVRTAAAAFTPASVRMISAEAVVLGAGSSITTVYGFMARNGIAQGGANYGFYSDIALNGANNYQLYMSSTGLNYFGGAVGIGNASPLTAGAMFIVGGTSQVTAATGYAVLANQTAPATMTSAYHGFYSSLLTAASAFTMGSLVHFRAAATTVGAGSAITNVYGLLVSAAAAVSGATNYGTYLELASATSTWNVYAAGTAQNFFGGPVGILATGPLTTGALLQIGSASAHPGVTTSIFGATSDYVGAATATTSHRGYVSVLRSAASAYTVTDVIHFDASTTVLGAGSTITNVYGFRVTSAVAPSAAGSVYGYYSALVAATGVFAFYGAGTAPSLFGGALIEKEITETYGTTVTIDARLGNERIVTVTNTTAWTMAAPTNPTTGQYLEITVRNTSGGVAGAITWNTAFKMTAFTNPANGFSRTIVFRYNGTNWVEKGRTAADVPN